MPIISNNKYILIGIRREILVCKGKSKIITALTKETFALIFPLILAKSFSLFKPIKVLCKNAEFVPELNAHEIEIQVDPIKKYANELEHKKDKELHLASKYWGNHGFILKNVERVKEIHCKGQLNFWEFP